MGSAASTTISQQAKQIEGRRYKRGMRPENFFEEVVKEEHSETFEVLGLSNEDAFALFVAFIEIDKDNSGEVSVMEFHKYLGYTPTKFSERVFAILDLDASGFLSLEEFVAGVWNYCTYDMALITKLVFDIFDVDKLGRVTMPELDAMLRMLGGGEEADG
ncbi:unnamed protein product, partial [Discosporangium mesarthrocarpum]